MTVPTHFDRARVRRQRRRAAPADGDVHFLAREMVTLVEERLAHVPRRFSRALVMGGPLVNGLAIPAAQIVHADTGWRGVAGAGAQRVVLDEELLPFAPASFDLVIVLGGLHWVNDLPGCLAQIGRMMQPDGFFIAVFPGDNSLHELRAALLHAETQVTGGAGQRIMPMVDVRDAGALLQRAGFAMPVADVDRLTVSYAHPLRLLDELHAMGEGNALRRRTPLRRDVLAAMTAHYQTHHAQADGRITATFSLVSLAGWAPAPGQPQPLRPGSAKARLAEALGAREMPLKQ